MAAMTSAAVVSIAVLVIWSVVHPGLGLQCHHCLYSEDQGFADSLLAVFGSSTLYCDQDPGKTPVVEFGGIGKSPFHYIQTKDVWSVLRNSSLGHNESKANDGTANVWHCLTATGTVNGKRLVIRTGDNSQSSNKDDVCFPEKTTTVGQWLVKKVECLCNKGAACNSKVNPLQCYHCIFSEDKLVGDLLKPWFGANTPRCETEPTELPLMDAGTIASYGNRRLQGSTFDNESPNQFIAGKMAPVPSSNLPSGPGSFSTLNLIAGRLDACTGTDCHMNPNANAEKVLHCVTARGTVNGHKILVRTATHLPTANDGLCFPPKNSEIGSFNVTEEDCVCTRTGCNRDLEGDSPDPSQPLKCYHCVYSANTDYAEFVRPKFGPSNPNCDQNPTTTPLLDASIIAIPMSNLEDIIVMSAPNDSESAEMGHKKSLSGKNNRDGTKTDIYHCITAVGTVDGERVVIRTATYLPSNQDGVCFPTKTHMSGNFQVTETDCVCNIRSGCNSNPAGNDTADGGSHRIRSNFDLLTIFGSSLILHHRLFP